MISIVDSDLSGTSNGPLRKAIKQWAVRYRAFAQRRFYSYARGGGDWPPLAPSTVLSKRGRKPVVLIDLGFLVGALVPVFAGAPGALEKSIRNGIRVGYGGNAGHPGGGPSVADIAAFHQDPKGGFLPQRKIIVPPPPNVVTAMRNDAKRALLQIGKDTIES